jgi:hypothetical protein
MSHLNLPGIQALIQHSLQIQVLQSLLERKNQRFCSLFFMFLFFDAQSIQKKEKEK